MQIAVLADVNSWYYREIARAAKQRGHECLRLDFSELFSSIHSHGTRFGCGERDLTHTDCLVVRSMPPGSLEQVVLRMDVLARLEAGGLQVVNSPKSLECAIDKYLTTARLAAAGLPVPETVCCQTATQALAAFDQLGRDVVVKPLFGAEGRGIVRVSDGDIAWRVFTTLERLQSALYLQRFVDHGGCDYRVLVLRGKILGGMRRLAKDDFRTNVARNGFAESHEPTQLERELALKAAEAVGTAFAGIDILYDREQNAHVIEVNAVPGWSAFARVNQMDVAGRFVESLEWIVGQQSRVAEK